MIFNIVTNSSHSEYTQKDNTIFITVQRALLRVRIRIHQFSIFIFLRLIIIIMCCKVGIYFVRRLPTNHEDTISGGWISLFFGVNLIKVNPDGRPISKVHKFVSSEIINGLLVSIPLMFFKGFQHFRTIWAV